MNLELSINRKGDFTVLKKQSTAYQCGKEGSLKYSYEVKITCTNKDVDSETGFVADNAIISNYFHETYVVKREKCESCERMAMKAVKAFYSSLTKAGANVIAISVTLHGSSFSFIEAKWNRKSSVRSPRTVKNKTQKKLAPTLD